MTAFAEGAGLLPLWHTSIPACAPSKYCHYTILARLCTDIMIPTFSPLGVVSAVRGRSASCSKVINRVFPRQYCVQFRRIMEHSTDSCLSVTADWSHGCLLMVSGPFAASGFCGGELVPDVFSVADGRAKATWQVYITPLYKYWYFHSHSFCSRLNKCVSADIGAEILFCSHKNLSRSRTFFRLLSNFQYHVCQ